MAIKKIIPHEAATDAGEKTKLKARFMTLINSANTVAELRKCLRILSRHVFNESDGE